MYDMFESPRFRAIRFFKDEFSLNGQIVPSLTNIFYPLFTTKIVQEISFSKAISAELALLAWLASLTAADRGRTHVQQQDGHENPLSTLLHVAADSGAGKSKALEEELMVFEEWESSEQEKIIKTNVDRKLGNEIIEARKKELLKRFSKSPNEAVLKGIIELDKAKLPMLTAKPLLLNDVTAAAYMQNLVDSGRVIRLESDGIALPRAAIRMVTKAWAEESNRRTRMTAPDGISRDPFIVDAVFTQPAPFLAHVGDKKAIGDGLMGRTLPYLVQEQFHGDARPMDGIIRDLMREKLLALLNASTCDSPDDTPEHRIITLSPQAENALTLAKANWTAMANYGGPLCRVKDFAARMPQHAVRLAGILFLAEYPEDSEEPISVNLMETAIAMTDVFAQHSIRWRSGEYEAESIECMRAIMLHVLEKNYSVVPEKVIKRALHHRFTAADIDVALYFLVAAGHLQEAQYSSTNSTGRSAGRKYINPNYESGGRAF